MKNIILYLVISTLFSFSFSLSEKCNPQDKKALLQLKKDFGNPYLLASWKSDTDCCSEWYQVQCDPISHRIISLTIFGGELSGQIPPSVGDLPYLKTLEFHKLTNVTGPIQPSIAKLKSLTFLSLSWLNLTGPVPYFLSQLKNLTFLELSFNGLSGSIPSSLASLPNLNEIYLDRNKLTGTIPASFGAFKGKALSLHLSHNQLSGKIPASLGNMNFGTVDLSRNKLEGDASMLFGEKKTTQHLDLSRNLFEFDLSKVVFQAELGYLDLNHNKIYGNLPNGMTKLNLQLFNVSYNRLCGKIPVGGMLQKFDSSTYFQNRCLCGAPLPGCK